jgi:hypothetical protein
MNDGLGQYSSVQELFSEVVDDWVSSEKTSREKKGIPTSKVRLKTELGRAMGLGNGSDSDDGALKGLYRYASGETSLSLAKTVAVCIFTKDTRLLEWGAFRAGLIATPRTMVDNGDLTGEDVFLSLIEAQKETASLFALLSSAYQEKPSRELMRDIENLHQRAILAIERGRILMLSFMDKMLKSAGGIAKGRPGK